MTYGGLLWSLSIRVSSSTRSRRMSSPPSPFFWIFLDGLSEVARSGIHEVMFFILQVVLRFFFLHLDLYGIMYVLADDMMRGSGCGNA